MAEAGPPTGDGDLVFASLAGTAPDAANVRRGFRRVTPAAGSDAAQWMPRGSGTALPRCSPVRGCLEDTAHRVGHANTRVTELVHRKELRPVLTSGATAMDQVFPSDWARWWQVDKQAARSAATWV